jgi:integrase
MARPRRGTLKRTQTKRGISYGVAFSYRSRQYFVRLGGEWEGWDDARAREEQRFLMEKVNRGEWSPLRSAPQPVPASSPPPTFEVEASEWLHRRKLRADDVDGRSKTIQDLEWRLSVVMDKFGPVAIDRIDFALADELVTELCAERGAIERAAATGAPLTRTMTSRTGRSFEVRRRAVSNGSIRKALDAAERVLRDAKRRGVLIGEIPSLKDAAPRADRPQRSFLEPHEITAVLRAADLIEQEHRGLTWETVALIRSSKRSTASLARELQVSDTLVRKVRRGELWKEKAEPRNRNDIPRRAVLETLILAGLRISELCGLDGPNLDTSGGRLRVPRQATKTDAGERSIPLVPALHRRLAEHQEQYPSEPGEPAFPTRNGTRQQPDNVRARILTPIVAGANALLGSERREPIEHLTPHTLRRTFASILAACDVPPRRAMYLMGHTNPTLTLAVYQQVLDTGKTSIALLEETLGCSLADARAIYNGELTAAETTTRRRGRPSGRASRTRQITRAKAADPARRGHMR